MGGRRSHLEKSQLLTDHPTLLLVVLTCVPQSPQKVTTGSFCSCPPPGWLEPAFLPPHPLLPTGWREDRPAAHPGPACTPRVTGSRASAAGKPGPPHPAPRPRGCPSEGYRRGTKAQQRGGLTHFPVTRPLPLCPQSLLEPASGGADPTPGVEGLNLSDQGQIPPVLRALVLAPAGWDPGTGW